MMNNTRANQSLSAFEEKAAPKRGALREFAAFYKPHLGMFLLDMFCALVIALDKLRQQGVYADLPLYSYVAAVSVGVVHETPVCDLDYLEDSGGEVDFNFVMDDESNIIELQGTGEERPFSKRELDEMYLLAEGGIKQLIAAQKRAVGHLFR